jgi:hypothetical protein
VSGRVELGGADSSRPLTGHWAVLHEVHRQGGAPVDSAQTNRTGRYQFTLSDADSGAVYLVSTTYGGITYFSEALAPDVGLDSIATLVVFDTSSVAPQITLRQRHIVVRRPEADGGRRVLELLVLANAGDRTRIASDPSLPVWRGLLPEGIEQFDVGDADVSAQAVIRSGDTVSVVAPVPPGEKQVLFTYVLPRGRRELVIPIDQEHQNLLVLLEDTAAAVVAGSMVRRGIEVFEDAQFAMFEGALLAPGTRVAFTFSRSAFALPQMWVVLVALAATALIASLIVWARRAPAVVSDDPHLLARQIAALDEEFARAGQHTPTAQTAYQEGRSRMKQRLNAALAAKKAHP